MSLKENEELEVVEISLENHDQTLEKHNTRFESLEAFPRSQYSHNKFILDKVSKNSNDIKQILAVVQEIKEKLGSNFSQQDVTAYVNPAFQRNEDIAHTSTNQGEVLLFYKSIEMHQLVTVL